MKADTQEAKVTNSNPVGCAIFLIGISESDREILERWSFFLMTPQYGGGQSKLQTSLEKPQWVALRFERVRLEHKSMP